MNHILEGIEKCLASFNQMITLLLKTALQKKLQEHSQPEMSSIQS